MNKLDSMADIIHTYKEWRIVGILFLVQNKTNSDHRASGGGALIFSSIPLPLAYSYTVGKRG